MPRELTRERSDSLSRSTSRGASSRDYIDAGFGGVSIRPGEAICSAGNSTQATRVSRTTASAVAAAQAMLRNNRSEKDDVLDLVAKRVLSDLGGA
ncbi:MAG: hypothetical protein H7Y88_10565 [Phycisphaerales bacterium]|nr:hypothetical protein [Phycisphaerales bacterium]